MLDVGVSKQLIACYYRYQDKLFTKVNSCCLGFLCLHLIRFGAPEKSEINLAFYLRLDFILFCRAYRVR